MPAPRLRAEHGRYLPGTQTGEHVLEEIRARAAQGRPLNSGANRGDWLYAAAIRFFGSWGNAVEQSGTNYQAVKIADLDRDEILRRIRQAADAGEDLHATSQKSLAGSARRFFKSWKAALKAAGCAVPSPYKWTREDVVRQIRLDARMGLPVTTLAVIARNEPLYGAGRRRFGSWAKALKAAVPWMPPPRRGRPRKADAEDGTRQGRGGSAGGARDTDLALRLRLKGRIKGGTS